MARFDRCEICDYSEVNGSGIAGLNPGEAGRVRQHPNGMLCDICSSTIHTTVLQQTPVAEAAEGEVSVLEDDNA